MERGIASRRTPLLNQREIEIFMKQLDCYELCQRSSRAARTIAHTAGSLFSLQSARLPRPAAA